MSEQPNILIIGGGLAGLFTALKLAPRPVTVLATSPIGEGASSAWAQGGIAAAVAEGDTAEAHARDTIAAGAGIVDEDAALHMAEEAGERVRDLLSYGVPFDKDLQGRLEVSREAAHSARRIVRVQGDMAGHAIMAALNEAVRKTPSIHLREGLTAEELMMAQGTIVGAKARDAAGKLVTLPASAVVLATGGIGHLYSVSTNPPEARGIGLAMAARIGAIIADAEFVQFHPTAIDIGRDPAPLATEALRGEGAVLVNSNGERFMLKLHPDGDLAPRDVVARGVFAEIAAGRGAFLDARTAIGASFKTRFPTVHASCMAAGIDPARDLIPIAPAEHYHMGGVAVDERGRSTIPNLWAAGEVACTGVHGANRLASNSLLEAVVFGARVAEDIGHMRLKAPIIPGKKDFAAASQPADDGELRRIMAQHAGVIRNAGGLARALSDIARIERTATSRALRNMATTALIVTAAAWKRRESRGSHYRSDYPATDPAQATRSYITLDDARRTAERAAVEPVPTV